MRKILIIDDDREFCEEIAEILSNEGYNITTAFDGLRAKALMERYNYDILILDVKLPGLSGLEILQRVKGQTKGPQSSYSHRKTFKCEPAG